MAGKKKAPKKAVALKKLAVSKPDPKIMSQPVPLDDREFIPVPTSGEENMCGMRSLITSLGAAVKALGMADVDSKLITEANFKKWLKSPEYKAEVKAGLDLLYAPDMDDARAAVCLNWKNDKDGYNEQERNLLWTEDLAINQLQMLLTVANEKLGTHFRLGQVSEGYWCRWDSKKEKYDKELYKTTVGLDTGGDPGAPMIFIYNNNESTISRVHSEGKEQDDGGDHWEGFATTAPKTEEPGRRQYVQDWEVGHFIDSDIANGVWVVLENHGNEDGHLNVHPGHFVRDFKPPEELQIVIPDGWRFMQLSNRSGYPSKDYPLETGYGLIPELKLRKIQRHSKAPTGRSNDTTVATSSKADFKVFRAIPASDKVGQKVQKGDFIDNFGIAVGDFFYDRGQNVAGQRFVRNIAGNKGDLYLSKVQLLNKPWGLPEQLPVLPDFTLTALDYAATMKDECAQRGIVYKGKKAAMYKTIQKHEDARTTYLPLYKVRLTVAATRNLPGFLAEEIVHVEKFGGKLTAVTDYEGRKREIPTGTLVKIDRPFNLRLLKGGDVDAGGDKRPREEDDVDELTLVAPPSKK